MTATGHKDASDLADAPAPARADAATQTIAGDVPCAGCGYNVRGLSPLGLCPECGFAISTSLPLYEARRASLAPPDAPAARAGVEGAVVSLLAFALMWVPAAAPAAWYFFPYRNSPAGESPGRVALLAAACAAWVLAWWGAWKLTRWPFEPPPAGSLGPRTVARWGLTLYASIPFLLPLMTGEGTGSNAAVLALLALLVCGGAGDAALFIHLAGVFRRCGWRGHAAQATFLAVASPAAMWFSMFIGVGRGGISSLDQMLTLPVLPYGVIYLLREFLYVELFNGDLPHPAVFALVLAGSWPVFLLVRLVACLGPHRGAAGNVARSVNGVTP